MKLYMSDFPFEYFLIVRNVRELGDVLASTLLQFIQEKWFLLYLIYSTNYSNFSYLFKIIYIYSN